MVKSIKTEEKYIWGEHCVGWHLLKNEKLSVIQEKMPAGSADKLHCHLQAQQFFYILSGTATFNIDGQIINANPMESVHIPKGIYHCIYNNTESELTFLVVSEPPSHGDRVDF